VPWPARGAWLVSKRLLGAKPAKVGTNTRIAASKLGTGRQYGEGNVYNLNVRETDSALLSGPAAAGERVQGRPKGVRAVSLGAQSVVV
jgi:hypothetical protein